MTGPDPHAHPHASDADGHDDGSEHAHDAHGDHAADATAHGPADDHGHGAPAEPLGPVDTQGWAAAIAGSVLAVLVILALFLAIQA